MKPFVSNFNHIQITVKREKLFEISAVFGTLFCKEGYSHAKTVDTGLKIVTMLKNKKKFLREPFRNRTKKQNSQQIFKMNMSNLKIVIFASINAVL